MLNTLKQKWNNLASAKLGAEAIACSDDFFAPMARMLKDTDPVFIDGKYDDNGKWMDGWESRRKRTAGFDYCIVKLCKAGVIHGIDIDTTHFTGNYPPAASVEACHSPESIPDASSHWQEIVPNTLLRGDSHHPLQINNATVFTHVRINIFPDGGIARLRIFGEPDCDWKNHNPDQLVDLAAALNGGRAKICNNEHFGSMHNLLAPGRGIDMGDGWETRRRREPGHDWAVIALGHIGSIKKIEIDTAHFKGNFPHQCSIQGALMPNTGKETLAEQSAFWKELLPAQFMQMDHIHYYQDEVVDIGSISHVRLNLIPDGGVSRLRLYGLIDTCEN